MHTKDEPEGDPAPPAPRGQRSLRSRLVRRLKQAVVVLVILALVLAAADVVTKLIYRRKLARLIETHHISDIARDNREGGAADHLEAAHALYRLHCRKQTDETTKALQRVSAWIGEQYSPWASQTVSPPTTCPTEADLRLVEAHLEGLREPLRLYRDAAEIGEARFLDPASAPERASELLAHMSWVRRGTELLTLEAYLAARTGRFGDAAHALRLSLRLGHILEPEGLMAILGALNTDNTTNKTIAAVLAESKPDEASLHALLGALASYPRAGDLQAALESGLPRDVTAPREIPGGVIFTACEPEPRPLWMKLAAGALMLSPYPEIRNFHYLRVKIRLYEAAAAYQENPRPPMLDQVKALRHSVPWVVSFDFLFSGCLLDSYARAATEFAISSARSQLARAAVALEIYERRHRGYPESLDALAPDILPAVPADTFSHKPLRYQRTGNSFTLYSIGPDLKDDGGVLFDGAQKGDILWRVLSPSKAKVQK